MRPLTGRPWWMGCGLTFALGMIALVPTTGDFGLTYDEPAYRYSQLLSGQWWERLASARSPADLEELVDPKALLFYWPYGRFGINFHPPLAGQLNLLAHRLLSGFVRDIPARRMASVVEFALTITILFGFLASRYGAWVGGVAAASLLLMPRLYGQAHLIDTDIPGLLIWAAAAVAGWNALRAGGGRWRIALGVLAGLAFLEKMAAVVVLVPILGWLAATRLPKALRRGEWKPALADAAITLGPTLILLGWTYLEIRRLADAFLTLQVRGGVPPFQVSPSLTDLFRDHPETALPGAILLLPLGFWLVRRAAARVFRRSPTLGRERPGLETIAAIAGIAPAVAWLGNPAWWRDALPRLAHYYAISASRQGVLPNIQILYGGQIYEYSLPWANAWVLMAITVPVGILAAAVAGLGFVASRVRADRLPLYVLAHFLTLPAMRMLPTPAHDGVRLFLPTFFFLAAFAGWGVVWAGDGLARMARRPSRTALVRGALATLVLAPAAWALGSIHPYELSYYNSLIGGPVGAWRAGYELTYWYDAFTPRAIADLNARLPEGAHLDFPNRLSAPSTFQELQSLGDLRADLRLDPPPDDFPHLWLLTHDSKAMAYTRLLFALEPIWESRPSQLGGARVAAVYGPEAAATALALQLLLDAPYQGPEEPARAPSWLRELSDDPNAVGPFRHFAGMLMRFWGDGLIKAKPLTINEPILDWARTDPDGLRDAADRLLAWVRFEPARLDEPSARNLARPPLADDPDASRLYRTLARYDSQSRFSAELLRRRPEALAEAVAILIRRPEEVRKVLTRAGFTDPRWIGGPLDQPEAGEGASVSAVVEPDPPERRPNRQGERDDREGRALPERRGGAEVAQ